MQDKLSGCFGGCLIRILINVNDNPQRSTSKSYFHDIKGKGEQKV